MGMYKDYEKSNSEDVNNGKGSVDEKGTLTDKESGLAEKAWNAMDTSKDGFIENHEFSSFFQGVVENMGKKGKEKKELRSQLKEYFKYFAGKDGKLSHVEYLRMMEVLKSKAGTEDFDKFLDALPIAAAPGRRAAWRQLLHQDFGMRQEIRPPRLFRHHH